MAILRGLPEKSPAVRAAAERFVAAFRSDPELMEVYGYHEGSAASGVFWSGARFVYALTQKAGFYPLLGRFGDDAGAEALYEAVRRDPRLLPILEMLQRAAPLQLS